MLRLAFEREGWNIPPFVDWKTEKSYLDLKPTQSLCFEKLLIPANQHQMFSSHKEAAVCTHFSYYITVCLMNIICTVPKSSRF